jgi:hypothetical protein
MTRLIAFGDSYTFGHYLPSPAEQAWPAWLGEMLGCTVVNCAHPGASNIEILTEILNFEFKPADIVVVGWTFIERDLIYKKSFIRKLFKRQEHTPVSAWIDHEESKQWLSVHNDYDLAVRSGLYIHHAELYLNSLNLKHYHFFAQPSNNKMPEWIHKPSCLIDQFEFTRVDVAEDNKHPGVRSHYLTALELYKHVK